jgi:hypothetical protein
VLSIALTNYFPAFANLDFFSGDLTIIAIIFSFTILFFFYRHQTLVTLHSLFAPCRWLAIFGSIFAWHIKKVLMRQPAVIQTKKREREWREKYGIHVKESPQKLFFICFRSVICAR